MINRNEKYDWYVMLSIYTKYAFTVRQYSFRRSSIYKSHASHTSRYTSRKRVYVWLQIRNQFYTRGPPGYQCISSSTIHLNLRKIRYLITIFHSIILPYPAYLKIWKEPLLWKCPVAVKNNNPNECCAIRLHYLTCMCCVK